MKKIILVFVTIITMMLCIASPLFIKPFNANAATSIGITDDVNENQWFVAFPYVKEHYGEDLYYAYVTCYNNDGTGDTICLVFDDCEFCTDEGYTAQYSSSMINYDVYIKNPTLHGSTPIVLYRRHTPTGEITLQEYRGYNCTEFAFRYDKSNSPHGINHYVTVNLNRKLSNGNTEYSLVNSELTLNYAYNENDTQKNRDRQTQFILPTETGSIDVSFNPSLSGVVTRSSVNDNGVSGLSNYFSMDITNNTAYGCQYRMMIKDTNGQPVTTYMQGDSDTDYQPYWETGFSVNDDGSFVFINDEWIYVSPTIGGGVCKALKPSEWHYIASGDSIHQDFSWSQFDFKKDHTYICMVYAITNDLGCATALDSYRAGLAQKYSDYCLDFTTQALVYQTVFTISNPATFNPNDNSFGNKIRNGNWSGDKRDFSAYENPANGAVISGNGNVNNLRDLPNSVVSGGSHGGGGYSTYHDATLNSYYGINTGSSHSFASLNGFFSSYFGFLNSALGAFPSVFLSIITAGFAGLVVVGIVKAAIK